MKRSLGGVFIVTMLMACVFAQGTFAFAAENVELEDYFSVEVGETAEGYIPDSETDINDALISDDEIQDFYGTLPSSFDLSTSKYFPSVIGNQGSVGACASFATAYYQFTYEANRLNDIEGNTAATIRSPRYIYNYVNGGLNTGTTLTENYKTLMMFGCLSLEDFPYLASDGTVNCNEWSTNIEAMRNALSTRVSSYKTIQLPGSDTGTIITSATDSDLDIIKEYINCGKMLVVSTNNRWDSKKGFGAYSSTSVAYRCHTGGGHAVAIVGYDDNIQCDVNGNGQIEEFEKGAFKVVNSWGNTADSYGLEVRNGYFWVLYDALNGVSANQENDWEDTCEGTRCTAFRNNNTFWVMYVENKEVDYVGEFTISTTNKNELKLVSGVSVSSVSTPSETKTIYPQENGTTAIATTSSSNTLVFDYTKTPMNIYSTGYNWYVMYSTTASFNSCLFRISDNLGKTIKDFGNISSLAGSFVGNNVSLKMGDMDYSGEVTSGDALTILKYTTEQISLSNVQLYLGDIDQDGVVDASDAQAVLRMVVSLD